MRPHTQKFLQQRKFYMVLPLLALPFITMIFWALGGGQGTPVQAQAIKPGLNTELPGAHFDKEDELWDKFSLYEQAKRDSLKYEEARRNDPYYVTATLKVKQDTSIKSQSNNLNTSLGAKNKYAPLKESEDLISKKLQQLTQNLEDPPANPVASASPQPASKSVESISLDVDRLEKMMEIMAASDVNDPEMNQIDGMLDKILDVQHPDRVRERMSINRPAVNKKINAVTAATEQEAITSMDNPQRRLEEFLPDSLRIDALPFSIEPTTNGFFGLAEDQPAKQESVNTIAAVIHDTQTIVSGSVVKLRLISDVVINGEPIPAGEFVYGVCTINGERLSIVINSIRRKSNLLPVALSVFDLDGMEGLYIPGAISRDVAKQAGSQSIQDVQLYSMDNSLGVQAASAGLEAAKGLFGKKTKLIKVTVKAGYQVLLQDTSQQIQTATVSANTDTPSDWNY